MKRQSLIILFGAPGTGKGTQSVFLSSHYHLHHISTGDLFRKAKDTSLGIKALEYMSKGDLVPDFIVISLIKKVLLNKGKEIGDKVEKNFLLDGFPRTLAQAEALQALLKDLSLYLDKVLCLTAPENILIDRMEGRRVAEKSGHIYHIKFNPPKKPGVCDYSGEKLIHRKDDKREVIQERLKNYYQQTRPLMEYYRRQEKVYAIDGLGSPETVWERIKLICDK